MNLPTIASYCHGANNHVVTLDTARFWFSYGTLVAFQGIDGELVVHKNIWSKTTGKHLNAICADKNKRVDKETFRSLYDSLKY